ncbi:unnamed protein product, partial (macronuclear) [Paramecium tetraurelia]
MQFQDFSIEFILQNSDQSSNSKFNFKKSQFYLITKIQQLHYDELLSNINDLAQQDKQTVTLDECRITKDIETNKIRFLTKHLAIAKSKILNNNYKHLILIQIQNKNNRLDYRIQMEFQVLLKSSFRKNFEKYMPKSIKLRIVNTNSLVGQDEKTNFLQGDFIQKQENKQKNLCTQQECLQVIGIFKDFFFHSVGGRAGSGFGSLLLEQISMQYPLMSAQIKLEIQKPQYANCNRIIAQSISSLTCPVRMKGNFQTLDKFQYRLVTFLTTHFLFSSSALFERIEKFNKEQIFTSVLKYEIPKPLNMIAKGNPANGKYMLCSVLYRDGVRFFQIGATAASICMQKTVSFDQIISKQRDSVCISKGEMGQFNRSTLLIGNCTSINILFSQLNDRFDEMVNKKLFFDLYDQDGISEEEFEYSRENFSTS